MPTPIDDVVGDAVLLRHDIQPPSHQGRGAREIEGGYRVVIGGHRRDDGQKMLTLTMENLSESRPCPFSDGEVKEIVQRFYDLKLLPKRNALRHMLEHLVAKAAEMYAEEPLESFLFETVRLHESEYRIGSVHMVGTKPVRGRKPEPRPNEAGPHTYDARSPGFHKKRD